MVSVIRNWTIRAGSRLPELTAGVCLISGLVFCAAILGNGRNDSQAVKPALDKPALSKPAAVKPGVVSKPSANAGATASTAMGSGDNVLR